MTWVFDMELRISRRGGRAMRKQLPIAHIVVLTTRTNTISQISKGILIELAT